MSRNLKEKLKVGQEVVIAKINDSVRYLREEEGIGIHNIEKWTQKGIVTKIGRKFIIVKVNGFEYKYNIESNYEEYTRCGSPDSRLYLSIDEIIEEKKYNEMCIEIRNKFSIFGFDYYNKFNLSYEQVEKIFKIINEK